MAKSSLYNKISNIQSLRNSIITPSNLKQNVNVFGVTGNYTNGATAKTTDIAKGSTAYVNGNKITGALNIWNDDKSRYDASETFSFYPNNTSQNFEGTFSNQAYVHNQQNINNTMRIGDLVIRNGAKVNLGYNTISSRLGITPMMIKKDVKILDITGQYDASTEFSGIKMDPVKASSTAQPLVQSITEVSGMDMTEGTNLNGYFNSLFNLRSVSNINATNVTYLSYMFQRCYNLASISDVNFYNDSQNNYIQTYAMFQYAHNLINIPNTVKFPKQFDGGQMFYNCINLCEINTPLNFRNSLQAFYNCTNLKYVNCTLNCINMYCSNSTFSLCSNLSDISNVKVVSSSIYASSLFQGCTNLNLSTCTFNNLKIYDTYQMFGGCRKLTKLQLINFIKNQYSVAINSNMLYGTGIDSILTVSDLSGSNYTISSNFVGMYRQCNNISQVSLDDFFNFFPNCCQLGQMFTGCQNLTKITHNSQFNFKQVYLGNTAFKDCSNLATAELNLNQLYGASTFNNCINLISVDLHNTLITSYGSMFSNCSNLTTINANESTFLNCPNVSYNYESAFTNCSNFKYNKPIHINTNYCLNYIFNGCSNITSDIYINTQVNSYYRSSVGSFTNIGSQNISINYLGTYSKLESPTESIRNCLNLKNLNINIGSYNNSSGAWYSIYSIYNCPNISTYNLVLKTSAANVYGYTLASNCCIDNFILNMSNITLSRNVYLTSAFLNCNVNNITISDLASATNISMTDLFNNSVINNFVFDITNSIPIAFVRCNRSTLSDSVIDNIMGIVCYHPLDNNGSQFKTNNILNISKMFLNCNVTEERISNMPNYLNLVNNGWQFAP